MLSAIRAELRSVLPVEAFPTAILSIVTDYCGRILLFWKADRGTVVAFDLTASDSTAVQRILASPSASPPLLSSLSDTPTPVEAVSAITSVPIITVMEATSRLNMRPAYEPREAARYAS